MRIPLQAVYSSPLERTIETAQAVAEPHHLSTASCPDLGEIRFGEWEGKSFQQLEECELWRQYNLRRSLMRPPLGEGIAEVQARMLRALHCLENCHRGEIIAVVSHADPLRAVMAHYLGTPLDLIARFEISPASVTVVEAGPWGPRVLCMNETGAFPL